MVENTAENSWTNACPLKQQVQILDLCHFRTVQATLSIRIPWSGALESSDTLQTRYLERVGCPDNGANRLHMVTKYAVIIPKIPGLGALQKGLGYFPTPTKLKGRGQGPFRDLLQN